MCRYFHEFDNLVLIFLLCCRAQYEHALLKCFLRDRFQPSAPLALRGPFSARRTLFFSCKVPQNVLGIRHFNRINPGINHGVFLKNTLIKNMMQKMSQRGECIFRMAMIFISSESVWTTRVMVSILRRKRYKSLR